MELYQVCIYLGLGVVASGVMMYLAYHAGRHEERSNWEYLINHPTNGFYSRVKKNWEIMQQWKGV
jgi:hypothetical protein